MPSPPPPETAPLRAAFVAQIGGAIVVLILTVLIGRLSSVNFTHITMLLAMLQGGVAATISFRQRTPPWWIPIHLFFVPLAVLVQSLEIASGWFLAGFLALLLVFWRTDKSRVPLYLSNKPTALALTSLLPTAPSQVLDVGCGDGGLLRWLAIARPDCRFVGIEHAPLPCLLAKLRCLRLPNVRVRFGDFWGEDLSAYDLVYAFLSPAPMPRLWAHAALGLKPGARLVSNSFAVPDVRPIQVIQVNDRRTTRLFIYQTDKADESTAFPPISEPAHQE